MKRRSDTRSPKPPELAFFTDRDLGKAVPRILEENGLSVVRYSDHYGERVVSDDEWIEFAARKGFVSLSHDRNIRSDPVAIRSVMENGGRVFVVRGKTTASDKAALVIAALPRICRVVEAQREAFIGVISRKTMRFGVIRPDVQIRLTLKEWRRGRILLPSEPDDLLF